MRLNCNSERIPRPLAAGSFKLECGTRPKASGRLHRGQRRGWILRRWLWVSALSFLAAAAASGCGDPKPSGNGTPSSSATPVPVPDPQRRVWMVQQITNGLTELNAISSQVNSALSQPGCFGFCIRVPWDGIYDGDYTILDRAKELADDNGKVLSVRFMAGRWTPAAVKNAGPIFNTGASSWPWQTGNGDVAPAPFDVESGAINQSFIEDLVAEVELIVDWYRENGLTLLHLPWFGYEWAELYYGPEFNSDYGGTAFDERVKWLEAHQALITAVKERVDLTGLYLEWPLSGHGPLQVPNGALGGRPSSLLGDHMISQLGTDKVVVGFNGWDQDSIAGPGLESNWLAVSSHADTIGLFTQLQAIQPWCVGSSEEMRCRTEQEYSDSFAIADRDDVRADYVEIYLPSWTGSALTNQFAVGWSTTNVDP